MKTKWMVGLMALGVLAETAAQGEVVATARSPKGAFQEFHVVLNVTGAPLAVANFMGLADGSQKWVDSATGAVRGGTGDAFYTGMVFDWNAGSVLRGGLRGMEGADGTLEYTGRPGYAIRSEVGAGGWSEVQEGTLTLVERIPVTSGLQAWLGNELDVLHSGGAELGLFLTNGVVPWTVLGQVQQGDEAGLRALAAAVASGATEVEWTVDTTRMTEAERVALEAAQTALPVPRGIETQADAGGLAWGLSGKSRLGISTSTNLGAGWLHQEGVWNEGAEAVDFDVAWGDLGLGGGQGFAAFSEVGYPAMAGGVLTGKWRIGVEHTGQTVQYWLDFTQGTGIWATVESGVVTKSGLVSGAVMVRETGNSLSMRLSMGMIMRFYWFGVEEDGDTQGRFQAAQITLGFGGEGPETDSGTYEWAEGWGDERSMPKGWRRAKGRGMDGPGSMRGAADDGAGVRELGRVSRR